MIVCDPVTDIFNPNVVRASTGVLFSVPLVVEESAAVPDWLKDARIRTVATTPAAEKIYSDADLRGPLAVVMGSEQYGLSEFWLKTSRRDGADSDGRPGRFAERRDGHDHHAVRSGAATKCRRLSRQMNANLRLSVAHPNTARVEL